MQQNVIVFNSQEGGSERKIALASKIRDDSTYLKHKRSNVGEKLHFLPVSSLRHMLEKHALVVFKTFAKEIMLTDRIKISYCTPSVT